MNSIKKKFSVIHLLSWLLIFLFFLWVFWDEGGGRYNPLIMAGTIFLIGVPVFYSHLFLLTRYWNRRRYALYLPGLMLILFSAPFLFLFSLSITTKDWSNFPVQYFPFLVLTFVFITLSWIAKAIENWFINTLKREKLEKQAMKAELSYLKSQINPHFLFNTLNNIHTLAYKNSPSTPEAIMRLSSLMRYMLYDSNSTTVSLKREVDYLQDFISLQQLRYKKAPVVDLEILGDADVCFIAPLLFIHLLENAYKHSPAQLAAGDIKVRVEIKENSLTFSICNPVGTKKITSPEPGGIGLTNLRKRLQLLYPDKHSLEVNSSEGLFTVLLSINNLQAQNHERQTELLHSR